MVPLLCAAHRNMTPSNFLVIIGFGQRLPSIMVANDANARFCAKWLMIRHNSRQSPGLNNRRLSACSGNVIGIVSSNFEWPWKPLTQRRLNRQSIGAAWRLSKRFSFVTRKLNCCHVRISLRSFTLIRTSFCVSIARIWLCFILPTF